MDIRPAPTGQTPQPGTSPLKESAAGTPVRPEERPQSRPEETPRDTVELSEAVRELQARLDLDRVPRSELTPERLKEIVARVAEGHYDRPEVLDELARRLAAELEPGKPEG